MKKKVIKNLVLYSSLVTLLFIATASSIKKKNNPLDSIKIQKNKIEYNSGTIYIGSERYLKSIKNLNNNDVLVLDNRKNKDPNLKIYDSYKIKNPEIREEIIDALLCYEEKYDTNWERSKTSLEREWAVHNYCYENGYEIERTKDVDLNNADEKTYRIRKNLLN